MPKRPSPAETARLTAPFARAFDQPWEAALSAKAAGRKVIGYLSATAPVELIEAAGAFALRLDGGDLQETPHADRVMERLFDPPVRGACELLLSGALTFLDAVILPRTTDSVQRLYYYLCEVLRDGGRIPTPLLYDLLHTPFETSAAYSHRALITLKSEIEAIAGPISDARLRAAIAASNRRVAALEAFRDLRLAGGVDGAQALEIYTAARVMAPEGFLAAMSDLLAAAPAALGGTRVILVGNGPDARRLHQAIERADALVVGDYHDRGELSFGAAISETMEPLAALSARDQRDAASARTFPSRPEALAAFALRANAAAAIFFFHAEEEVLTWDFPGQRAALEAVGVPSLCLSAQPYRIDAEATHAAVAAFLAERRAA